MILLLCKLMSGEVELLKIFEIFPLRERGQESLCNKTLSDSKGKGPILSSLVSYSAWNSDFLHFSVFLFQTNSYCCWKN